MKGFWRIFGIILIFVAWIIIVWAMHLASSLPKEDPIVYPDYYIGVA